MPRVTKRKQAEDFILAYEALHNKLPSREEILGGLRISDGTANTVLFHINDARGNKKSTDPIQFSKAQKNQMEMALKILKKQFENEFNERVRLSMLEHNETYRAGLDKLKKEAAESYTRYNKLINNYKAIFTADEFKTILMCLHPDGERSKEKLEEAFKLFKEKQYPLTGGK